MNDRAQALREQAAGGTFYIVCYNHPDYAWTHHREWHEERYAVSTCEALDLMREHPHFRFCMEPWIDHVIPFLERCPERADELRKRLNSGQMGVKAFTLTSPRPSTCADETFIRNMTVGRRTYQAFAPNADLSVMACPDVAIGHSQMPQICRLAGARAYRGWRSDTALSYLKVPREFVWRGLDGSGIITSRGCYGGLVATGQIPDDFADRWEETVEALYCADLGQSLELSQSKARWVAQGMDDARPLKAFPGDQHIPLIELMAAWNQREHSRMVFATPNEYGAALAEQDLPVWEGVIDQVDVAYNSGWHGVKGLWKLRQQLDAAMVVAERAWVMARVAGVRAVQRTGPATSGTGPDAAHSAPPTAGTEDSPTRLADLWWETIRLASHALQWTFEKDWEWLTSRGRYALREINEETAKAVTLLAGVGRKSGSERPLVLFNPLPYQRDEIIEVPWVQPRQDAGGHVVLDAEGNTVPLQLGEQAGATWGDKVVEAPLIFRAKVPALGCAVYTVDDGPVFEAPPAPEGDVLDNGALTVRLSGRGLQSVTDNATGLAWTAPPGSCIGDCVLHEMADGILHIGPITGRISGTAGAGGWVLTGPQRWVYRWRTEFHGQRVRQDVILDAGCRHVDFVTRVYCGGANGFFALCFGLPLQGEMHVDIPFGVEKRDLTHEVYAGSLPLSYQNIERHRDNQFWARSFASLSDGEKGITVISQDGDKYWTWDAGTGELRHILFTPLDDDDADWEAWVTKERMALGWHEFRHRVVFHDGDWKSADACGASDRARVPLQALKPVSPWRPGNPAVPGTGEPPVQPTLALSPASVRLSAFYQDGDASVLRVYESAGEATDAQVKLPGAFASAARTDFNLEPVEGDVTLEDDALTVPLRPWEIATVVLR